MSNKNNKICVPIILIMNGLIWILTANRIEPFIRGEKHWYACIHIFAAMCVTQSLLVKDNSIPRLSILHLAASRGSSFLVQSPSLFIFHHMALLMMQSLINHNTISWANQLNTNSTYQTTLSLFARLFNCKIFTWSLLKIIYQQFMFWSQHNQLSKPAKHKFNLPDNFQLIWKAF